jgi:hypothetical protein
MIPIQQWEYIVVESGMVGREITAAFVNGKEISPSKRMEWYAYLNWLGNQGWEMVGVANSPTRQVLYFKRLKEVEPPPVSPGFNAPESVRPWK